MLLIVKQISMNNTKYDIGKTRQTIFLDYNCFLFYLSIKENNGKDDKIFIFFVNNIDDAGTTKITLLPHPRPTTGLRAFLGLTDSTS